MEENEIIEETEKSGPVHTRARFTKNHKYEKPEVEERVVELRSSGKSWTEVTNVMKEELDEPRMSNDSAERIYSRAIAKTITTEKRVGKKFTNFTNELNDMYGRSINVLTRYINAAEEISKELEESIDKGDVTAVKAYAIILKTAPQMKSISSEIREFMKLQLDMQDKVRIEQKGMIYDEIQMLDEIEKVLNKLEKEGKIRWIKQKQ